MSKKVGVIAENTSDVQVIKILINKILNHKRHKVIPNPCNGHGKIMGKCKAYASDLKARGCGYLILVHDLDEKVLKGLQVALQSALMPCPIQKHIIVIPIKEIESWLLSDGLAIKKTFNLKKEPKEITNPETIKDPKEKLEEVVRFYSEKNKFYHNTVHNGKIAEQIRIHKINKCSSFIPFLRFVQHNLS